MSLPTDLQPNGNGGGIFEGSWGDSYGLRISWLILGGKQYY